MKTSYEFLLPDEMKECVSAFGCYEDIESFFGFEISCGDGLFLSDLDWYDLEEYDGKVDADLIRLESGRLIRAPYRVSYKHDDVTRENSAPKVTAAYRK